MIAAVSTLTEEGLSPRVRGNRQNTKMITLLKGSIPACAGNLMWEADGGFSIGSIPACAGEP